MIGQSMESIYWQLKLFRSLSAKTRHATYSVILSLLICLFFILGYYFDWGAPLDVLSLVFAPVVEIYLAIKAMTAFQAKRVLVTMIYALTLGFVVTVLGIAGASNGQARSFAARIFVLKNYKQLERQIESAQKKSASQHANVEFIVNRYSFSDDLLIYDESQELLKPASLRSPTWRDNHRLSEFTCPHSVVRVQSNYFLVNFAC